jgi:hypothetical protein
MDDELCGKLSAAINGSRFDDTISAMISTMLMLIIGVNKDPEVQNKLLDSIVNLMRDQIRMARIINETGSLPN